MELKGSKVYIGQMTDDGFKPMFETTVADKPKEEPKPKEEQRGFNATMTLKIQNPSFEEQLRKLFGITKIKVTRRMLKQRKDYNKYRRILKRYGFKLSPYNIKNHDRCMFYFIGTLELAKIKLLQQELNKK